MNNKTTRFKAINIVSNEWNKGYLIEKLPDEAAGIPGESFIHDGINRLLRVHPSTVCEFTGLILKNEEVWTNDLFIDTMGQKYIVGWHKERCCFAFFKASEPEQYRRIPTKDKHWQIEQAFTKIGNKHDEIRARMKKADEEVIKTIKSMINEHNGKNTNWIGLGDTMDDLNKRLEELKYDVDVKHVNADEIEVTVKPKTGLPVYLGPVKVKF